MITACQAIYLKQLWAVSTPKRVHRGPWKIPHLKHQLNKKEKEEKEREEVMQRAEAMEKAQLWTEQMGKRRKRKVPKSSSSRSARGARVVRTRKSGVFPLYLTVLRSVSKCCLRSTGILVGTVFWSAWSSCRYMFTRQYWKHSFLVVFYVKVVLGSCDHACCLHALLALGNWTYELLSLAVLWSLCCLRSTRKTDYAGTRRLELCPYSGLLGSTVDTAVFGGCGTLSHILLSACGPRVLRSILPALGDDFWKMRIQRHSIHAHASVHEATEVLHFSTTRCSKFDHGVLAVGHGILLRPHQRVQLDHGVFSVGHGTLWCSEQRASWCLTVASVPMVPARWWRARQVCSPLSACWYSPVVSLLVVTACTEGNCPYAAFGSTCSLSRPLMFPRGGVVGFQDVTAVSEQVLMSALRQQPVSFAFNADQSSFPLCGCTAAPSWWRCRLMDVTTDCVQVLMSALSQQPVLDARSSFLLFKTGLKLRSGA